MDGVLKKVAIGAFLLFLIGVAGNGVLFALGMWNYNNAADYRELSDTYVAKSAGTKSIDLKITSGDVRIVRADVDRPTVRIWRWTTDESLQQEELISEAVQGDVLHLKIGDSWRKANRYLFIPFKHRNNRFEVLLPQAEYETMVINASSGRVQAENLEAGVLTARMSSGQFKLENCRASEIAVTADSGSFDMVDCQAAKISSWVSVGHARFENVKGKLDISSSSGHIDVAMNEILDDVLIRSSSGFADIKIGHVLTPFRLEATASTGKLDIELPQAGQRVHSTNSFKGSVGEGEGLLPLVKVEVSSGKATIR